MENVRPIDANELSETLEIARGQYIAEGEYVSAALASCFAGILREESMTPTLDCESVRHAHWIENQDGGVCSDCRNGLKVYKKIRPMIVFCPFCGAKMEVQK